MSRILISERSRKEITEFVENLFYDRIHFEDHNSEKVVFPSSWQSEEIEIACGIIDFIRLDAYNAIEHNIGDYFEDEVTTVEK